MGSPDYLILVMSGSRWNKAPNQRTLPFEFLLNSL